MISDRASLSKLQTEIVKIQDLMLVILLHMWLNLSTRSVDKNTNEKLHLA